MKTTLVVKGTHCKACKMMIEDVCGDIQGVTSCTVDFKTGKTVIEHDDSVAVSLLKKEIEDAGEWKVA